MNKLSQLLIPCLVTLVATPAFGQVFFGGRPNRGDATATQKKAFERELATKIGDMKRACKLSDTQVRKLELAAKGAVMALVRPAAKRPQANRPRAPDPTRGARDSAISPSCSGD